MEVPDYYKDVSVRLMRVLDTVGLREDARWKRINTCLQGEELLDIMTFAETKVSVHVFGSQAEATNTVMLNADFDFIFNVKEITVLQDMQYWRYGRKTYLMIMDETMPPGYVKLQKIWRDQPIAIRHVQNSDYMLDRYGRSVLCNITQFFKLPTADDHHGPANTIQFSFGHSFDNVIALRSLSWPYSASEWITRQRKHNWPSRKTVSIIQQSGTFLVPVGHKESDEKHLEWRISLSYGEKILVWQFNHTQYKCYVLLKMIKRYFIKPEFGDNALSSYHCKTCMFWMIETTPEALWQPQNVLLCIDLCLRKLCAWVEEGYFPNYFIPAENMFLGIVHGRIQSNLANSLRHLIRQKGRYLTTIPCDRIGLKLIIACLSPITHIDDDYKYIAYTMGEIFEALRGLLSMTWFQLLRCIQENPCMLQRTFASHGVRQEINTILRKFCCSSLGSLLASKCLEQDVIDQECLDLAHEFLLLGSSSDVASGKIKLASFHLLQNNVVLAEYILQDIEANYTFLVSNIQTEEYKNPVLLGICNSNLSTTELVRYYSAFPVPYLPSEIHCTPKALIPEMFRSTGSYEGFLEPVVDYWLSWAVVDPKLYLHFLKHLCYHRQNKFPQKMAALYNMIRVIRHERLEYLDTAFNLLAYCLRKDGFLVQSYKALSTSMKLKNHHNAAKWQLAYLISTAFSVVGYRH